MANNGIPLDAFLIVDNNAVVNLCNYYCDLHKDLPFTQMIRSSCEGVSSIFNGLRRFSIDNKIITTKCVQDEFKPERGTISRYPGFDIKQCNCLKNHIQQEIEAMDINMRAIARLRGMDQTPSRLGKNLDRLSDQDLSLVILALGICRNVGQRVYILTDEEDLRYFTSWMKTRPEVMEICASSYLVDGLHSMMYLDYIHRQCTFPTSFIQELFSFLLKEQLTRSMLYGTKKGEMITQTANNLYQLIQESSSIKQSLHGGLPA